MTRAPALLLLLVALVGDAGCTADPKTASKTSSPKEAPMSIELSSSAFAAGQPIPKKYAYTGEGDNVSPPLAWSKLPAGTKQLALIVDDPDAPRAEPWVHWVAYGIAATETGLAEGASSGFTAGKNDWGKPGWGGPMPPKGHGVHHYHFKLFALDAPVKLAAGATKTELLAAIDGHVLAQGELIGTYERK